jgi:tetratricopeptide (TPR) repeat protein
MSEAATQEMVLPDQARSMKDIAMWAGVLALLVLVSYGPAMQNGFIWDDPRHVTENKALQSGEGLWKIWFAPSRGTPETYVTPQYYPLTHTTFWIEYHLWGLDPTGYHVTNIVLHAISAILVWLILRQLAVPGAWVIAAVFAIHPIQVESVAWVTERKNTLCGALYFGAILAYLKFEGVGDGEQGTGKRGKWYALALALFIGALLSKTIACSMPAVMLLLLWWKRKKLAIVDVAWLLPFFVLGALASANTAWMEKHVVRAVGPDWQLSAAQHILVAGRIVWFYIAKLLWPAKLTFIYPRWSVDASDPTAWFYPALVLVVFAILFGLRRRIGRAPVVAWTIFVLSLVPAMGFVNVYPMRFSYVADHFQYLAGLAFIALVVGTIARDLPRRSSSQVVPAIVAVVLLVLAVMTWRQAHLYANPETLWRDTIAKNDSAWIAHSNLGAELLEQSQQDAANGRADLATKKLSESQSEFAKAVTLYPDYAPSNDGLGLTLLRTGHPDQALEHFIKASALEPESIAYLLDIASAYEALHRPADAQQQYVRAQSKNPHSSRAYFGLGRLLESEGNLPDAQTEYEQAIRFKPDFAEARYRLALLYARQKKDNLAMDQLEAVLNITPDFVAAHSDYAALLAKAGRLDEAAMHYNTVIQLDPNNADAIASLAYLVAEKHQYAKAKELFEIALKVDPNNVKAKTALAAMRSAATTRSTTRASTAPSPRMPAP